MKTSINTVLSTVLLACFGLLVCTCSSAGADSDLPDGLRLLKAKMEQNQIPNVDFNTLKFSISNDLPEGIDSTKGFLWGGQYFSNRPQRGTGQRSGGIVYIFLLTYDSQTGQMKFFRAREQGGGKREAICGFLVGRVDPEDKTRIELASPGGNPQTLWLKNKDQLVLRASDGYEADLRRIGTIIAPSTQK